MPTIIITHMVSMAIKYDSVHDLICVIDIDMEPEPIDIMLSMSIAISIRYIHDRSVTTARVDKIATRSPQGTDRIKTAFSDGDIEKRSAI